MGAVKKVVGSVFGGNKVKVQAPKIETKVPAQKLERQPEVEVDDIQMGGSEQETTSKGKRSLLRPVANSGLGV